MLCWLKMSKGPWTRRSLKAKVELSSPVLPPFERSSNRQRLLIALVTTRPPLFFLYPAGYAVAFEVVLSGGRGSVRVVVVRLLGLPSDSVTFRVLGSLARSAVTSQPVKTDLDSLSKS